MATEVTAFRHLAEGLAAEAELRAEHRAARRASS
jgi:hypothetical protein